MHKLLFTLITGASEGLGKYFALECASRKMNLVLVALPQSGLSQLATYLREQYKIQIIILEIDIASKEGCEEVFAEVKDLGIEINILINNAGIGGTFSFEERSVEYYNKIINLNILAPTLLSRLFFSDLNFNNNSYILNVSSLAGLFRLPNKQVYGATKAYLVAFSENLQQEIQNKNLHVCVLCPGGMDTTWYLTLQNHLTGTWLSRNSILHPKAVAEIAIAAMLKGKKLIVPGKLNRLFVFFNNLIPQRIKHLLTSYQIKKSKIKISALTGLSQAA
ncbi:MAG: SDR family NAD(P)-dependent oxidoreductase [Chitinophagaceae bacterium]